MSARLARSSATSSVLARGWAARICRFGGASLLLVATGEDDVRTGAGQGQRRLVAEPAVGAGDDDGLAGQVGEIGCGPMWHAGRCSGYRGHVTSRPEGLSSGCAGPTPGVRIDHVQRPGRLPSCGWWCGQGVRVGRGQLAQVGDQAWHRSERGGGSALGRPRLELNSDTWRSGPRAKDADSSSRSRSSGIGCASSRLGR